MKSEFFIANRLYRSDEQQKRVTRPSTKVALIGIAIGTLVMIITLCVVVGFKRQIVKQVVGFSGHFQVVNFDNNSTYEMKPIFISDTLLNALQHADYVQDAQPFITKPSIIKTDSTFQTVIIKGYDLQDKTNEKWKYFEKNLVSGYLPDNEKDIIISKSIALKLNLDTAQSILFYFVNQNNAIQVRKWRISGIYQTGFSECDNLFVVGDIKALRPLNQWDEGLFSGVEVTIDDFSHLDEAGDALFLRVGNQFDKHGNGFFLQSLIDLNSQIFAWLELLNTNVWVIFILMLAVSSFNIISGLIIIILNNVNLIGTLKALGATNNYVRRVFLIEAALLIGKGLLWGNTLGLAFCLLQRYFHLVPLDASMYYVNYVPIDVPILPLIYLNIFILTISLLVLLLPSVIISHISPAKVLRFE